MIKKCIECGKDCQWFSKKRCRYCAGKSYAKPKPKMKGYKENKEYYNQSIEDNIEKHGGCRCENCGDDIQNPTGRNVSHIIAKGSNPSLYHDPINHYILCRDCESEWTDGDRTKMNIYQDSQERRMKLLREHYGVKKASELD